VGTIAAGYCFYDREVKWGKRRGRKIHVFSRQQHFRRMQNNNTKIIRNIAIALGLIAIANERVEPCMAKIVGQWTEYKPHRK
jgi:hypothetical protein